MTSYHSSNCFTRRVLFATVDLQKENGLLSVQWTFQLEGFLYKIGNWKIPYYWP